MGVQTRMSQELEPITGDVIIPLTGELVDLANPNDVGRALAQVREMKHQLDGVRAVLEDALRVESVRQGTKTLHLDGLTAVISGGEKTEWDVEELNDELQDLGLPASRIAELIGITVTYKVNKTVAKQLSSANPRYAEAITRHSRQVPDYWRVTVKKGLG